MQLTVQQSVNTAVSPSANVMQVAAMFGLGLDDQRRVQIIAPTTLELAPHQVVFITGDSGGGKSTLLRLIHEHLMTGITGESQPRPGVLRFNQLPQPPDAPLVDCFGDQPLDQTLALLSRAGLNDAFVMLRRPSELSDGQRYRLALAQLIHAADSTRRESDFTIVLADEFGATLDRITASVLARNIRKWTRSAPVCFIAATTHDDLLEPLEPDVLIVKPLGPDLTIHSRDDLKPAISNLQSQS